MIRPPSPKGAHDPDAGAPRRTASQPLSEAYDLEAYRIDAYVPERLVEGMYDGRTLGRLAARKLARKFSGGRFARRASDEDIVAFFGGLAVFDRPEQQRGGLAFGRDFPRVLNELGVRAL